MGDIIQDNIDAPQREKRANRTHERSPSHAPPQKRPIAAIESQPQHDNTQQYEYVSPQLGHNTHSKTSPQGTREQATSESTRKKTEDIQTSRETTYAEVDPDTETTGHQSPFAVPLLPPGTKTPKTDQRRKTPTCKIEKQKALKKKATPQAKKPPIGKTPIGKPVITHTDNGRRRRRGRAE